MSRLHKAAFYILSDSVASGKNGRDEKKVLGVVRWRTCREGFRYAMWSKYLSGLYFHSVSPSGARWVHPSLADAVGFAETWGAEEPEVYLLDGTRYHVPVREQLRLAI